MKERGPSRQALPKLRTPDKYVPFEALEWYGRTYRLDLAFVMTGKAHAISFEVGSPNPNNLHFARNLVTDLTSIGLLAEMVTGPNEFEPFVYIISAKKPSKLADMRAIRISEHLDDTAYGRLCGIPETAIQAYVKGQLIKDKDLPASIRRHPYYPHRLFGLSRRHYRKEWAQFVGQVRSLLVDHQEVAHFLALEDFIRSG